MENLLVAFTNAPAYYPIIRTIKHADYLTTVAISFVACASFISHLAENHKHGMPGIGFRPETSYLLNRLDVIGCLITSARLVYCYCLKHGFGFQPIYQTPYLIMWTIITMLLGRISEYDKYNPNLKHIYIPTHCLWHISVFMLIDYFLSKLIY